MLFSSELAEITQRGNFIGFQMSNLSLCETLGICFAKTKLHCRIPFLFSCADLGNKTWPSFDEGYRIGNALLIEDLGHADLSTYQPFQHTQFSPLQDIDETANRGNGRIISVRHSQLVCEANPLFARKPTLAPSLTYRHSGNDQNDVLFN